ncbi:MAG: sodium-dependent transporter [Mogibacterium sp.]|nr:sodium-dependent transporter [Mogibacterium sp.]
MQESRGFASKIGFILTMAAFCIGIGNLWKFPYVVGAQGGGAFLLVYLILVFLLGIPLFIIEVTLGRSSQLSPIKGMAAIEGKKTGWSVIGWLEFIAIFGVCTFSETIIGGWSPMYVWKVLSGQLSGLSAEEIGGVFGASCGSNRVIIWSIFTSVLLAACLLSGVKKGVEKLCSILMPTLLVLLVLLAVYANLLPGASAGLKWYLTPDFSKINMSVIGAAAAQVFFSIGIGMLVAYVYGSYIAKNNGTGLPGSMALTAVLDTCVAVLAGLICTPALFAFGMEPTAGPSLIFVTLPTLFNAMGGIGRIFGTLFMLCVFAAGYSSMLGGCEAMVATIVDSTKLDRKKAVFLLLGVMFVLGIFITKSFDGNSAVSGWTFAFGFGLFDFVDFLSEGLCMPIAGLLMYIFAIWKWGYPKFMQEVNEGTPEGKFKIGAGLGWYFKYVLPVLTVFAVYCILHSFGVI